MFEVLGKIVLWGCGAFVAVYLLGFAVLAVTYPATWGVALVLLAVYLVYKLFTGDPRDAS